jgi:hypothetical protein
MAKAYSLASWNVEHFRNPDSRVDRVVDFLVDLGPPDVFALYEVEGKEVFDALVAKMPGYAFHITEVRRSGDYGRSQVQSLGVLHTED